MRRCVAIRVSGTVDKEVLVRSSQNQLHFTGCTVFEQITVGSVIRNTGCSTGSKFNRLVINNRTESIALHPSIADNRAVADRRIVIICVRCRAGNIRGADKKERVRLFDNGGIISAVAVDIVEYDQSLALCNVDDGIYSLIRSQNSGQVITGIDRDFIA